MLELVFLSVLLALPAFFVLGWSLRQVPGETRPAAWSLLVVGLPVILVSWASSHSTVYAASLSSLSDFVYTRPMLIGAAGASLVSVASSAWSVIIILSIATPVSLFFFLMTPRSLSVQAPATVAIGGLVFVGSAFVLTDNLVIFLISFELLLVVALYLLRLTSKSERIDEAVVEMTFWTLVGSLCLFAGFLPLFLRGIYWFHQLGSAQVSAFSVMLILAGFSVKVPVWPCSSWLLKAHVEASTEFSILLSGVILKFGVFGLYRVISLTALSFPATCLAALSFIGMFEASFRLLSQRDLKRIVALTTVVELNWVSFCIAVGSPAMDHTALFVSLAHSFTTAAEFYLVDCLYRRFGTRDLALISGLYHVAPLLFVASFVTILVTVGFPGSSIFLAKCVFFTNLAGLAVGPWLALGVLFLFFLPLIFFKVWVPVWFGTSPSRFYPDLTAKEVGVFSLLTVAAIVLGVCPTLLFI